MRICVRVALRRLSVSACWVSVSSSASIPLIRFNHEVPAGRDCSVPHTTHVQETTKKRQVLAIACLDLSNTTMIPHHPLDHSQWQLLGAPPKSSKETNPYVRTAHQHGTHYPAAAKPILRADAQQILKPQITSSAPAHALVLWRNGGCQATRLFFRTRFGTALYLRKLI